MSRQNNYQAPFASINSPTFSQSNHSIKGQLGQLISSITKQQHHSLNDLSQKCSTIQYAMGSIQVLVAKLTERLHKQSEKRESQMLGSLKMKQYEFIIGELKGSLSKQSKKQERLIEELECQKKKAQKFREQIFKLQAKNNSFNDKIARLDSIINQKNEQIQQITLALHKYKVQNDFEGRGRSQSAIKMQIQANQNKEYYRDLQSKLQQLESELQTQIATLQSKNKDLYAQIKKHQQQYEDERSMNKVQKKQIEQMSIAKYELEIKLKQQMASNSQLEETYNKLLQKSNNTQIALHKQIQQYKSKQNEIRMQFKKQKKNTKLILSQVAQIINNNSKYYLTGNTTKEQTQQIKRLYQKIMKKKNEQFNKQMESCQVQIKRLKSKCESSEQAYRQLQKKQKRDSTKIMQYLSQKDIEKNQQGDRIQKNSDGGNSFVNKSIEKQQEDRYKNIEEKYKSKLQVLRKDLKVKQTRINQLQKQQQSQFDKSKEKILQLELAVSQKFNELRKFELKFREKQYEIQQVKTVLRELQNKNAYLNQKIQNEKESNNKILEMRVQNYQQKIKNLKNNYKQLQKKQQQKTIKYNKLKAKYQKYELQASQSLKRKNVQIDQLLKENNKLKTQNKLLQQKININNIIQKQVNCNKTPNPSVNQDLIEQIQMERDRISAELVEKQKKYNQILDSSTKMNGQIISLRRQLRQIKQKFQQANRQLKLVNQQNKFTKEKLQQINQKKNQQTQAQYIYLKKQLQTNLTNRKKLEKKCQKYSQEREQVKKQVQQLQNEINTLKINNDKLKQKYSSATFEIQQLKDQQKRLKEQYQIKISQASAKAQQLVDIINYKNREGCQMRQSMKGQELIIEQQQKIKFDKQTTTTGLIQYKEVSVNTDKVIQLINNQHLQIEHQIIPSEMILDQQFEELQSDKLQDQKIKKQQLKPYIHQEVNYFNDLVIESEHLDDHFDICEQGQEINIGQASINLQIKDVFNGLRKQIQKIFNEQEISIQMMKVLPKQLEDDFNDFMAYIKQKIYQIKRQNNLSFIMAQMGSEPESIQQQLVNFISKEPKQVIKMRKIIQQKQIMITSLMNQKTQQQNTINQMTLQKEEIEEQTQNKFMNQCNVYKREIRQYKRQIDILQMNCQSLKNIFRNTFQLWVDDKDNQDDIKDNIVLYSNICKLTETDKKKLASYLDKYRLSKIRS